MKTCVVSTPNTTQDTLKPTDADPKVSLIGNESVGLFEDIRVGWHEKVGYGTVI
jgi:hypothetical protein